MRTTYLFLLAGILWAGCKQSNADKASDITNPSPSTVSNSKDTHDTTHTSGMSSPNAPATTSASQINGTTAKPAGSSHIETYGRYLIKSGYIEMLSNKIIANEMRYDFVTKKTFDNYGRDEKIDANVQATAPSGNSALEIHTIMRSGWLYSIHPESFIASRSQPPARFNLDNMEFSLLDADAMHTYNMKGKGTEVLDGKTCTRYDIDYHNGDDLFKGTLWVYKNILYTMNVAIHDGTITAQVTRLDENITVDAHKFDIPEGYRVEDSDAQ